MGDRRKPIKPEDAAKIDRSDEDNILRRERPDTTYAMLLRDAVEEGRIGGQHPCQICGMRHHTPEQAAVCCEKVTSRTKMLGLSDK